MHWGGMILFHDPATGGTTIQPADGSSRLIICTHESALAAGMVVRYTLDRVGHHRIVRIHTAFPTANGAPRSPQLPDRPVDLDHSLDIGAP